MIDGYGKNRSSGIAMSQKMLQNHYTNLTFVCDVCDVRAGGHGKGIRSELKTFIFLHRWTWMLHVYVAAH